MYITGRKCKRLDNFRHIYEIPRAIKDAISKPARKDYDEDQDFNFMKREAAAKSPYKLKQDNQVLHTEKLDAYKKRVEEQKIKKASIQDIIHIENDLLKVAAEKANGPIVKDTNITHSPNSTDNHSRAAYVDSPAEIIAALAIIVGKILT